MNWKLIARSLKNKDMRNKVLAVMSMLLIFRLLAHIPIPLSNPQTLRQLLENLFTSAQTSQFLSFLDVLSGGALANFSIMLIGLGPYINASIIMQLLTKAIPKLEALNKEGEFGRKKINQYTRILTLPLAIIQSIGAIFLVRQTAQSIGGLGDILSGASISQWILMVSALTGGAMLLMWLGELITEQNIGNGISLLITVGIVSSLPQTISGLLASVISSDDKWVIFGKTLPFGEKDFLLLVSITAITVLITMLIVKLNEAQRKITIHYAKRVQGNRSYGGVTTMLPVKLITAGVVPIIFALAFLSLPSFVGQLLQGLDNPRYQEIGTTLYNWFQPPTSQTLSLLTPEAIRQFGWSWEILQPLIYPLVYFLLVFIFTYFYTSVTFNSQEIAENLQKQGGFIEGVRSGKQTEKYLSRILGRLTLFGALSLGFLAIFPILSQWLAVIVFQKNIDQLALGGTSILILVSVALETLRQIESKALMVTYDKYEQPDYFAGESNNKSTKRLRLPKIRKSVKNSEK